MTKDFRASFDSPVAGPSSASSRGEEKQRVFILVCSPVGSFCAPRFPVRLCQALRQEEANESQSMADFLKDLVSMTLTDKVGVHPPPLLGRRMTGGRCLTDVFYLFLSSGRRHALKTTEIQPVLSAADEIVHHSRLDAAKHGFRVYSHVSYAGRLGP